MNRPLCYVDKNGEIIGWIIAGAIIRGAIGGGTAIAKGQNFWHGNAIAQGRGVFSWKNTPVGETGSVNSVPEAIPDAIAETPNDVSTYQSTSIVVYDEPSNPEILIHYTTENGYKSIMESKQFLPSVGIRHARYGDGQYFTNLNSIDYTAGQLSRRLYRVAWNKSHLTHFIKIDVSGLNIIKNGPHNFLLPNNQPLNLNNRIVGGGVSIFKIKF